MFSLTWSASMQIYWNKRKRLHKMKEFNSHRPGLGHQHPPTWPPFHCLVAVTSCENTLYINRALLIMLHPHPHFDPFRLAQSEERWNSEREESSDHASVGVITSLGCDILLSQETQYHSLVRKE